MKGARQRAGQSEWAAGERNEETWDPEIFDYSATAICSELSVGGGDTQTNARMFWKELKMDNVVIAVKNALQG